MLVEVRGRSDFLSGRKKYIVDDYLFIVITKKYTEQKFVCKKY